jgi:hypothetical protein
MHPYFQIPDPALISEVTEPGESVFYVRFSKAEIDVVGDDGRLRAFWQLEGFSQTWFDNNPPPQGQPTWADQEIFISYYSEAWLFLLELEVIPEHIGQFDGLRYIQEFVDIDAEPKEWFLVRSGGPRGDLSIERIVPMTVHANLFSPGTPVTLDSIEVVDEETRILLDKAVSTDHLVDATLTDVRRLLNRSIDWAVVYDVGQGNCIGLCDSSGSVSTYFDFGGGVTQNRKTFPSALQSFCFTNNPPIILSHWDHDHWSSAYLDHRSFSMVWILPRQPLTPQHVKLLSDIAAAGGTAWFLPSGFNGRWFGHFYLEICTGSNRNNSGIALTLSEHRSGVGEKILMPGDADYRYIGSVSIGSPYLSVVAAHHGGALSGATTIPGNPGRGISRLVYSTGANNSYRHPLPATRRAHDSVGWKDPKALQGSIANDVRETSNRSLQSGLGHVYLGWRVPYPLPPTPCGSACNLESQQS